MNGGDEMDKLFEELEEIKSRIPTMPAIDPRITPLDEARKIVEEWNEAHARVMSEFDSKMKEINDLHRDVPSV